MFLLRIGLFTSTKMDSLIVLATLYLPQHYAEVVQGSGVASCGLVAMNG